MGALRLRWDQPLPGGLPERHPCDYQNDSRRIEPIIVECLHIVLLPMAVALCKPCTTYVAKQLYHVALAQPRR